MQKYQWSFAYGNAQSTLKPMKWYELQLVIVDPAQALEDPFFGGEYFEAYEHLEEPKMVILEE